MGVLRKHVGKYEFDNEFKQGVIDSFYVDDFNTIFFEGIHKSFKKLKLRPIDGGFNLDKCKTNEPNLRKIIGEGNPSY